MAKYLDKSGVTYLWNKIKGLFTDQSLNTKNKTYAGAINEINTKVGNLTGAFLWKGKFDTLPAVTNYEAGNVVGVGKKEYVLTVTGGTKAWEEFGDEGSYLLKTTAEETYLKKTAGEVKTANLADNAVTSAKLATGARKPIILTPSTTEVDEETYQKLLSDDVDVVFKMDTGNLFTLTYKLDEDVLILFFTCLSLEGDPIEDSYIYAYEVSITKVSPHTCSIINNTSNGFATFIENLGYLNKSTLSPILKEIDLTGTDADRKAKLDKFETDWKALTGADDLTGARFVGITSNEYVGVFTWSQPEVSFVAVATYAHSPATIYLDRYSGQLTEVPLSSHLEPVEIFDDNSIESKKKNIDNIEAYKSNLEKLGVDTSISFQVPIYRKSNSGVEESGFLIYSNLPGVYKPYSGLFLSVDGTSFNIFGISSTGEFIEQTYYLADINYSSLTTTSKQIVPAINEVNAGLQGKADKAIVEGFAESIATKKLLLKAPWGDVGVELLSDYGTDSIHIGMGSDSNPVRIIGVKLPQNNNDAANKEYVDSEISGKLPDMSRVPLMSQYNDAADGSIGFETLFIGSWGNGPYLEKASTIEDPNASESSPEWVTGISIKGAGWSKLRITGITHTLGDTDAANKKYVDDKFTDNALTTTTKNIVGAINEVNALAKSKQDALTSGTNIKTVNGKSLLGSGDIAISGGGDVTAAGDNTFTGNNVFTQFVNSNYGFTIQNENINRSYYLAINTDGKFWISDDSDVDVEVTGVDTPTQDNAAANKKYVDDKVAAAGGVANKLTVTNFDSNSGRPISIQDTDLNDVLYVENNVGISYDGPMLTIKKCDNGSGSASCDAYVTNICGKGIEIGSAANGDYDYGTVISKGEILLYGSPVITTETLKNELPIRTNSISSTTTETIRLVSSTTSAHRIILANPSGTKTILLPAAPYDGETFEIIRIEGVSFILTNNSGKAMQKCTGTTTVTSMNISSSGKYTCIYSSSVNRWYVMRDDFVSF